MPSSADLTAPPNPPPAAPRVRWSLGRPGVLLFRRCRFGTKAVIISLAFALPLALLGISWGSHRAAQLADTARERDGVALTSTVVTALRLADARRALPAAPGAPDVLAQVLDTLLAQQQRLQLPGLAAPLEALAEVRAALVKGSGHAGGDAPERLSAALLALLETATDASGLTLDPEAETYFAMDAALVALPRLADLAGRLQARADAGVAGHEAVRLDALIGHFAGQFASDLGKLHALRPDLAGATDAKPVLAALAALRERAGIDGQRRPVAAAAGMPPPLQPIWTLQERVAGALDAMLAERQRALRREAWVTACVVAAGVATAAYLFRAFFQVMTGGLGQVSRHLRHVGQGRLTQAVGVHGRDEIADLLREIDAMRLRLAGTLRAVRLAADNVAVASQQLAIGTGDLAQRTEQAASRLQHSASAMDEMRASLDHTSDASRQASALAAGNAEVAQRGGAVIGQVVSTMAGIQGASSRIGEIVGTIDGIAFQTNLLALNAAVEAARAGESGRGFAVVAGEVRRLAKRSADASREIRTLVEESARQTQAGAGVVQAAGTTIAEVVGNAERIHEVLGRIDGAAREQAIGIAEVNRAVGALDSMTQQNAALVEQASAAADALMEQAALLASEAARFELPVDPGRADEAGGAAAPATVFF